MRAETEARDLLSALRHEAQAHNAGDERPGKEDLASAIGAVEQWLQGDATPLDALGHRVVDEWSLTHPLSERIVRFVRMARLADNARQRSA